MKKILMGLLTITFLCVLTGCSQTPDGGSSGGNSSSSTPTPTPPDTTPPVLTVGSLTNGQGVGGTYTLSGTVSDSGSGVSNVYVSLDGGLFGTVSISSGTWTTNLTVSAYGKHTNYIYAIDNAANVSLTNFVWVERTSVPSIIVNGLIDYFQTNVTSLNFSGTASIDPPYNITGVEISVNGGAYSGISGTTSWSASSISLNPDATNTVRFRVTGNNLNTAESPIYHIVVNIPAPSVSITSPSSDNFLTNQTTINLSGTAFIASPYSITKVELSINGGAYADVGNTAWNKTGAGLTANMTNNLKVRATANSGKSIESAIRTVIVDTIAPAFTFPPALSEGSNLDYLQDAAMPPDGSLSDNLSGCKFVYYSINGHSYNIFTNSITWNAWDPAMWFNSSNTYVTNGTNSITAYCIDYAGNACSSQTSHFFFKSLSFLADLSSLYAAMGLAVDSAGNSYIPESETSNKVYKISSSGTMTEFANLYEYPEGIAIDASGNLFVAEDCLIEKVTPAGVVSTFAGSIQGTNDGTGTGARFDEIAGITVDSSGNVYVMDDWIVYTNRCVIRKISSSGVVTTIAGGATGYADGNGMAASFNIPYSSIIELGVDNSGYIYVPDSGNNRIRKVSTTSPYTVTTLAGSGSAGSADGNGTSASFKAPEAITVDSQGNLYVADLGNNEIRKITSGGMVSTFANQNGCGYISSTGYYGNVNYYTSLMCPRYLGLDNSGNLFYLGSDSGYSYLMKLTTR